MKVAVIGTGHVGLVTCVALASVGHQVAGTDSDCVVVGTEWNEFRSLDLERLKDTMAHPLDVDGRNVFDPATIRRHGFTCYPTGRPAVIPHRTAT
jgi:UDPglucose 6-dehydrogenase